MMIAGQLVFESQAAFFEHRGEDLVIGDDIQMKSNAHNESRSYAHNSMLIPYKWLIQTKKRNKIFQFQRYTE